jgi:hypothetical protein
MWETTHCIVSRSSKRIEANYGIEVVPISTFMCL